MPGNVDFANAISTTVSPYLEAIDDELRNRRIRRVKIRGCAGKLPDVINEVFLMPREKLTMATVQGAKTV